MPALPATPPAPPPALLLPTGNHALLDDKPEDFFQFVDRSVGGVTTEVWQGGQFGFVRNPTKLTTGETIYSRFHEGLDIKPLQRDAKGEPLDEVHAICAGEVVHCSVKPNASNYGRYVVIKHDWGEGPFCSLYAHLKDIKCTEGQKIEAGGLIGIMGYSGSGIDRRRAHTHLELTLYLSSRFSVWHDHQTNTLNYHGMWNGLNLVGLDVGKLYLDRLKQPTIKLSDEVKQSPPYFRIAVPGSAEMELLDTYPWLSAKERPAEKPKRWEVTFTAWGLPTKIEAGDIAIDDPKIIWVQPSSTPHYSLTRGLLSGKGETATLTTEGEAFIKLATGLFDRKPKPAVPAVLTPKKKKGK